jgi:hypothetical protein
MCLALKLQDVVAESGVSLSIPIFWKNSKSTTGIRDAGMRSRDQIELKHKINSMGLVIILIATWGMPGFGEVFLW